MKINRKIETFLDYLFNLVKKYNLESFSRRLLYFWCAFFETLIVESLFPEKIIETQSSVTVLGKRMCDFICRPRMINKDQKWAMVMAENRKRKEKKPKNRKLHVDKYLG